jgi:Fic family protein
MNTLDLEMLNHILGSGVYSSMADELQTLLRDFPGPYDQNALKRVPWQSLQFSSDVSNLLHANTVSRLEENNYADGIGSLNDSFEFTQRRERNGLTDVLGEIRKIVTDYKDGLRTGPVAAEAGYTCKVAIFPPAERIPVALQVIEQFRKEQPLLHPIWNILLSSILLLRLHPFSDGNGRTMRAFVSYELWRSGMLNACIIPLKKALDANRANEIQTRTALSHSRTKLQLAEAYAAALLFDARVISSTIIACCHK